MLLTIGTTHQPATDLGYLLGKHPDRCQSFTLKMGQAHVFYPEASADKCTVAMILDIDPIGLVRGRNYIDAKGGPLDSYVSDRPYVASSFLSVAIARVFGTAMRGVSDDRPELADTPLPLVVHLSCVPSRGGPHLLEELFAPLGYNVEAARIPMDETFPSWGDSSYYTLRLEATLRLADVLHHLYVLIPVLDNQKHYWIGDAEVENLLSKGGEWLAGHPMRTQIVQRYLKRMPSLYNDALARLTAEDIDQNGGTDGDDDRAAGEDELERPISLNDQRMNATVAVVREVGAERVLDLGCGEGKLIRALAREPSVKTIVGMDVSIRALERAHARLHLDRMSAKQRERIELFHGSLTYRDSRFAECDVACAIEVIEHLDPSRLDAFERVVFEFAAPPTVVITTPNIEYNVRFATLPAGAFRHSDHRFEWTRDEFQSWCDGVAKRHGYTVRIQPVGDFDEVVGSPTQMGVFRR